MSPLASQALIVGIAYLVGSIPFGLLIARWVAGVDVRTVGSGNVGATNVGRVLGKKGFAGVFVLDALKGALPVLFLPQVLATDGLDPGTAAVLAGVAAILGHVFSVFLRLKGGKGVATTAGVIIALSPAVAGITLATFVAVALLGRTVSLASVLAAVSFPVAVQVLEGPGPLLWMALAVAVLVVVRHRGNLARIAAGTEPRIGERRTAAANVEPTGGPIDG